jgi:UDPglucose 6-dehydrogenase
MLATRISFMNELANLADRLGVDIEHVRKGIGSGSAHRFQLPLCRHRLWRFLLPQGCAGVDAHGQRAWPGAGDPGFGGVGQRQAEAGLLKKIIARLGEDLSGKTFAVWGLAFKPNTDDMRAPSRVIVRAAGARCPGTGL